MPGAPPRLEIRVATLGDLPELHGIADRAAGHVMTRYYTEREMEAARSVGAFHVEDTLVTDGTYYVVEIDGRLVGGSGWSRSGALRPSGHSSDTLPTGAGPPGTLPPGAGPPGAEPPGTLPTGAGPPDMEGVALLRAAYIDPGFSRLGLISLLVGVSEIAARLAGCRRCEAVCTPPAEGMLGKLGYHLVERTSVPMSAGVSWQGARMRKTLVAA